MFGPDVFAALFGFCLGLGWLTYITFSGYYLMVLLVLLQGSVVKGMAVWGTYAIARSLPLFIAEGYWGEKKQYLVRVPMADRAYAYSGWLLTTKLLVMASSAVVVAFAWQ